MKDATKLWKCVKFFTLTDIDFINLGENDLEFFFAIKDKIKKKIKKYHYTLLYSISFNASYSKTRLTCFNQVNIVNV